MDAHTGSCKILLCPTNFKLIFFRSDYLGPHWVAETNWSKACAYFENTQKARRSSITCLIPRSFTRGVMISWPTETSAALVQLSLSFSRLFSLRSDWFLSVGGILGPEFSLQSALSGGSPVMVKLLEGFRSTGVTLVKVSLLLKGKKN